MKDTGDISTRVWISILVFATFIVGIVGIAAATGWRETMHAISKISPAQFGLLLSLSVANYLFRSMRWYAYTRAMNISIGFGRSALQYLGGFALTATPGRVGELIRLRWLWRETGAKPDTTGSLVLVDRAADLTAVGLLLAASIANSAVGISGAWTVAFLALAAAWVVTRPALFRAGITLAWKILGMFPKLFVQLRRAASGLSVFSRPSIFIPTTALGMLGWCAEALAFYLLLSWLGADVTLPVAFAIFFFSILSGGASGLPGGIGGAEAAMIALLTLQGVSLEIAIPATAIIRLTTLWFAIILGMILFPFAERRSSRVIREV